MSGIGSETERYQKAIIESWERCERQYGLERSATYPVLRLQATEVAPRLESIVEQTGGRCGIFRQLSEIAARTEHCLVLSDADRIVVRLECKNKGYSEFERNGIAAGSLWSEQIAGTNGVSMAMSQRETVTVSGKDHFFAKLNPFACTAVPLFDAQNQMIGAATLVTIDHGSAAEYIFAQQLLEQAARQIQRVLFDRHFNDSLILSIADTSANELLSKNELLAVDESGIICGASRGAGYIAKRSNTTRLVGQRVEAIVGFTIDELMHEPGKNLNAHVDTGSVLNVSLRERESVRYPGRGWDSEISGQKSGFVRPLLSSSLRDLSIGSQMLAAQLEQAQLCFNNCIRFLIEGETGTGKTELVNALHAAAGNTASQLVKIDCATLEDSVKDQAYIDSILNHAFYCEGPRGCDRRSATLLLENIDEMSAYGQARLKTLLETIESGEQSKDDAQFTSLRIVATSQRELQLAVRERLFRGDLYYLLCGARFILPPLRQREGLASLTRRIAAKLTGTTIELPDESIDIIREYNWPGNIRELRSVLRRSLVAGHGERLSLVELRQLTNPDAGLCLQNLKTDFKPTANQYCDEKTALINALLATNWNVTRAARNMGIGRATIHRRMAKYGISRPAKKAPIS